MGFTGAQAENLTFPYGGEKVLDGLDVEVPKGKITGIVGHSGSGKCPFMENKTFLLQLQGTLLQAGNAGADTRAVRGICPKTLQSPCK